MCWNFFFTFHINDFDGVKLFIRIDFTFFFYNASANMVLQCIIYFMYGINDSVGVSVFVLCILYRCMYLYISVYIHSYLLPRCKL